MSETKGIDMAWPTTRVRMRPLLVVSLFAISACSASGSGTDSTTTSTVIVIPPPDLDEELSELDDLDALIAELEALLADL